jgi:hypothetical protein
MTNTAKKIGGRYRFVYPNHGTPKAHASYAAHTGQAVTVVRLLSDSGLYVGPLYGIRADDGWIGTAYANELRPLPVVRYARIPGSPTKGEDVVRITSHFTAQSVYVARLVKSSGRFGKRRYLIAKDSIREEVKEPAAPTL